MFLVIAAAANETNACQDFHVPLSTWRSKRDDIAMESERSSVQVVSPAGRFLAVSRSMHATHAHEQTVRHDMHLAI